MKILTITILVIMTITMLVIVIIIMTVMIITVITMVMTKFPSLIVSHRCPDHHHQLSSTVTFTIILKWSSLVLPLLVCFGTSSFLVVSPQSFLLLVEKDSEDAINQH